MPIRLSIVVLTFDRVLWLRSCLANLRRALHSHDDVEVLISDDAGPAEIAEVARQFPEFRYRRNLHNLSLSGNMVAATEETVGEYVWMLGDDDLVYPDSIATILSALELQADLWCLNYNYWIPAGPPDAVLLPEQVQDTMLRCSPCKDRFHRTDLRFLRQHNPDFVTAIYGFVLRRPDWLRAARLSAGKRLFETFEAAIPHAVYIVSYLSHANIVFISDPLILVSHDVSWSAHMHEYMTDVLPRLRAMFDETVG